MNTNKILIGFYVTLILSIILGVNGQPWSQNLHVAATIALMLLAFASYIGTMQQIESKTLKITKGRNNETNRQITVGLLIANLIICIIAGAWIRSLLWVIILILSFVIYLNIKEYKLNLEKGSNENQS